MPRLHLRLRPRLRIVAFRPAYCEQETIRIESTAHAHAIDDR